MAKSLNGKNGNKKTAKKAVDKTALKPKVTKKRGVAACRFAKNIRVALEAQDRYTPELEISISMAAEALHIGSRARQEISSLDATWTTEVTKTGFKIVEHPALKTHRAYMAEARKCLQALGLTFEDIVHREKDALSEFDRHLEEEG